VYFYTVSGQTVTNVSMITGTSDKSKFGWQLAAGYVQVRCGRLSRGVDVSTYLSLQSSIASFPVALRYLALTHPTGWRLVDGCAGHQ
jgi:hypothetical protein